MSGKKSASIESRAISTKKVSNMQEESIVYLSSVLNARLFLGCPSATFSIKIFHVEFHTKEEQ